MKKLIIATTIAFTFAVGSTQPSFASNYSNDAEQKAAENTKEMIGFGSGAATGALVGGPLGAIIGGVFGILIANDINDKEQLASANSDLNSITQDLNKKQQTILSLQNSLQNMQEQQMIQLASLDEQTNNAWLEDIVNFETNLQFKTASFLVEDIYTEQLTSLASVLVNYPQLSVQVTGYADQRGDSQYNKELSEQRAKAVKSFLLNKNVSAAQISVQGMGETPTSVITNSQVDGLIDADKQKTNTNIEDLFFARKVNVRLHKSTQQMTAAN